MSSTPVRTVNIRGKAYVDVAERVRLSHADEQAQGFSMIEKERYELNGRFFYSVTIEVKSKFYTGEAEVKFDAPKNTPDGTNPMECAQTSALGRALGFAGYGSLESIASADEVTRAISEREAPKERYTKSGTISQGQENRSVTQVAPSEDIDPNEPATTKQLESIQMISQRLNKATEVPATYGAAKELIAQLSQEYRQSRAKAS